MTCSIEDKVNKIECLLSELKGEINKAETQKDSCEFDIIREILKEYDWYKVTSVKRETFDNDQIVVTFDDCIKTPIHWNGVASNLHKAGYYLYSVSFKKDQSRFSSITLAKTC